MSGSTFRCVTLRIPGKLTSSSGYIVVFKKTTSQEVIDKQAEEVNNNGGKVYNKVHSSIIKVCIMCSYGTTLESLILYDQSITAEIPDSYFQKFQSNLASEIDYIGEGHSIWWIEHDDIKRGQCRTRFDGDHTITYLVTTKAR